MAGKPLRHCLVFTLVVFLAVLCGGALSLRASSPAGDSPEAVYITALTGDVQAYVASRRRWVTAFPDMRLLVGDEVKTGADSFAEISFGTAATVRLEEKTHIIINRDIFPGAPVVLAKSDERSSAAAPPSPVFQIKAGTVLVQVAKGFARLFDFSVETPTAIAGVRGTIFMVRVGPAGNTTITVYKGVVAVRAENQEVLLQAGETTVVDPGAPPKPPRRDAPGTSDEKMIRWLTRRAEGIRRQLSQLLPEEEDVQQPQRSAEDSADDPGGLGSDKQRERLEKELEEIESALEQLGQAAGSDGLREDDGKTRDGPSHGHTDGHPETGDGGSKPGTETEEEHGPSLDGTKENNPSNQGHHGETSSSPGQPTKDPKSARREDPPNGAFVNTGLRHEETDRKDPAPAPDVYEGSGRR